eukprot:5042332-Amphidinium_carterae.1
MKCALPQSLKLLPLLEHYNIVFGKPGESNSRRDSLNSLPHAIDLPDPSSPEVLNNFSRLCRTWDTYFERRFNREWCADPPPEYIGQP